MFGSVFDDLKYKVDGMLRLAVAGMIAAMAGIVAFFCFAVALFLWMQQEYGTLEAWLALASLFLAVAIVCGIVMIWIRRRPAMRREPPKPREATTSPTMKLLQEPAVLLTGLQIVRTLGVRGMLPIILLGAIAGGFLLNRNGHAHDAQHEQAEYEAGADPT